MVMAAAAQGARMEGKGPWPGAWPAGRPEEEPALARLGRPHGARQRTAGGSATSAWHRSNNGGDGMSAIMPQEIEMNQRMAWT